MCRLFSYCWTNRRSDTAPLEPLTYQAAFTRLSRRVTSPAVLRPGPAGQYRVSALQRASSRAALAIDAKSFQPLEYCSVSMMLFLIPYVIHNPRQILRTKTYYAITVLPIQQVSIHQLMIHVM